MKATVGILFAFLALAASADTLLTQVQSSAYEEQPIPESWIPAIRAESISSPSDYPRSSVRSVEIAEFVKVYGVPSRLLTPRDRIGYSYLVYDLADGYKLLVYVPSLSGSRFAAAQLLDSDGLAKGPLLK